MLAEALPVSHGAHFSGDTKASALQDMMRTVSMTQADGVDTLLMENGN